MGALGRARHTRDWPDCNERLLLARGMGRDAREIPGWRRTRDHLAARQISTDARLVDHDATCSLLGCTLALSAGPWLCERGKASPPNRVTKTLAHPGVIVALADFFFFVLEDHDSLQSAMNTLHGTGAESLCTYSITTYHTYLWVGLHAQEACNVVNGPTESTS